MGRLDDRVIIVTGGAHGIGRAYCLGLANEGAKVVVADLDGPGAESVVRTLGESGNDALAVVADVSAPMIPKRWPGPPWTVSEGWTDDQQRGRLSASRHVPGAL